jgi:hypothetical protein
MNSKGNITKHLVHLDEKVIKPNDKVGSSVVLSQDSAQELQDAKIQRPISKPIIGRPRVYDLEGNLLASEENLVVLVGREVLAQLIAGTQGSNPEDYTSYRITHFAVGDGGTTDTCPPNVNGPFDDDTDLEHKVVIKDPIAGGQYPNYAGDGYFKLIEANDGAGSPQGEISVLNEEHTINVPGGGQLVVHAYTAVRYRMYLQPTEPKDKPFKFNEAGLYAMEWRYDSQLSEERPTGNYRLFARFTTLDKYLEAADGIMIEWYILV